MIKYSGETISGMHYSGYTIVRAYGCGGELVFGTAPPTPTGTKVIYTISGTSYTIPCDYDPVIDKIEILQDMSRRGLPIQDETSAMTDVVIGDCVTSISANTFNECEAVTSFTISNSVTTIGHDAFKDCIVLPSITLPSGITTIEDGLFENDFQLSAVTIPSGVTAISESAFYDNISLLNIEIPSGVTSIGMGAFRCSNWTNPQWKRDKMLQVASGRSVTIYATVPPTLEQGDEFSIFTGSDDIATYPIYVPCESVDAYKAAWSQYASRIQGIPPCNEPKWVATYSDSHTESAACDSSQTIVQNEITLTNLQSVEIGSCVNIISGRAFYGCSLTSVTIPDSVTSIGNEAFRYCGSLTSVTIPSGVTNISYEAFRGCTSLTSIIIEATTPPTLGGGVFSNTNDCPIMVPAQSVSAYQNAWSDYASRIQSIT